MLPSRLYNCVSNSSPQRKNLKKAEQFIQQAATQANIIVFPEDFLTGPVNGDVRMADYAGRYVRHFQQLARDYVIDIVPGSIIEGNGNDGRLYNTTYYIDSRGEIKGRYCKVNLWHLREGILHRGRNFRYLTRLMAKWVLSFAWH